MKKAYLNINVNVKDDFDPGDCENCPFASIAEYEDAMRCYHRKVTCSLGYCKKVCPLDVYPNNCNPSGGLPGIGS